MKIILYNLIINNIDDVFKNEIIRKLPCQHNFHQNCIGKKYIY